MNPAESSQFLPSTFPPDPSSLRALASRRLKPLHPLNSSPTCALKSARPAVTVRSESANTPPSTTSVTNRQPSIYMGKTIELPDPLFAEINGYAHHVSATPVTVIRQAWNEFRRHHPQESATPPMRNSNPEELLAMVRALRGSISLPADVDDKTLIAEARLEKYGPL